MEIESEGDRSWLEGSCCCPIDPRRTMLGREFCRECRFEGQCRPPLPTDDEAMMMILYCGVECDYETPRMIVVFVSAGTVVGASWLVGGAAAARRLVFVHWMAVVQRNLL